MNITGGKFNGRKIITVKSNDVRPTSSKVRASIFNMLRSLDFSLENKSFLDLFSGSGIMGLEALSRGAQKSFFVEKNIKTYNLIKQNLLNFDTNYDIYNVDALKFLNKTEQKFDIIFVDPPYMAGFYDDVIDKIFSRKLLLSGGFLILETPLEYVLPSYKQPLKEKIYGDTKIYFLN